MPGTLVKNKGRVGEGCPAVLLLTYDIFHIPHVHLPRLNGSYVWEKSGWVRSHTTDQARGPDGEAAWSLSVFTVQGVNGVTAGQVSAHIRSAGLSDKGSDGKSTRGPTVQRLTLKIWELITINDFSFSSSSNEKHTIALSSRRLKMGIELSGNSPDR